MSNSFNLQNYIELFNKSDLSEIEENQLFSYRVSVEKQITYNRKEEYLLLIKEYLAEKMDPDTFRADFLRMQEEDSRSLEIMEKNLEQLINFSIDSQSKGEQFFGLINLIYDSTMLAFEFGPEDGISDDAFRASIENAFSKFLE